MPVFKSEAKVELELIGEEDLKIRFNSKTMDDLIIRRSRVSLEEMGAEARMLLAAALAECMCSTLLFLLKWANVEFEEFRAVAEAVTAKDEMGRLCVDSINLKIHLDIPKDEDTMKKFKRVENLFKRGCLMSRSLERGIKVNYSLTT
ncbi:OsmC family protein [Candidatus Bathyarchaeota archaeon]|nr:OsmC family protein [Candidatus Bathyarchaeota archaeon]